MTFEGPNFPKIYTSKCPTKLAWSPTEDASEVSSWYFEQEYYKDYMNSTFLYYNPPTGEDSSTTAYVYWNTDENCEDPETINLEIRADDEGASYGAAFVLKQKLSDDGDNVTYIEHPVTTHLGRGDNDTYGSLKLPVADDTMSFIMSATPYKGFEISEIKYTATEKTNSEIGENSVLGWNGSDSTLTVNTALLENLRFNVTFSYVDFNVGFVRPTDAEATGLADVKVFVPDEYQGTELSWFDSKAYTIASSGIDDMLMPILYAKGGCVAWSKDPSYTAGDVVYRYFDNAAVEDLDYNTTLYPVYFTSADFVSYDVSLSGGMGYEVGYDDLCGDSPTGTFTVTANVNTAEGLTRMELWQIIGAEGENSHADTIKNVMTQDDQNQNLYTLEIPKVTYTDEATGDESVVPFTFEIHAVPAEGYTTYKDSYYKKNAEDEKVTIANGKLTTTGNDEVFHVDLIVAENYNLVFETEGLNYFWYWMAGLTTPYHFYYNLYITDEDRESLPEAYELGETAQKLPILHAVGFGPNNSSGSYTLLGWTMYADSAYCIAGSDRATSAEDCIEEDSPNLFKTYSGDMVVAIQASGITLDENKTVKLYPVWNHVRSDAVSNILVRCPADVDGCSNGSPIDRPMTVTLSQTFNAGGQQITLTNVSEDKATMYATYPNIIMFPGDAYDYNFTIDVSYKANAGYKFSSIDLKGPETKICQTEDADECMIYSDGTLRTKHAYSPMGVVQMEFSFVPHELSFTPYTLTFDISSLDSEIVAFGQSWYDKVDAETGKAVMNVGTANEFPNLYALHSGGDYGPYSFNEVYWTKEQAPENETEWNAWYGTYITSSMKQPFNSDLVTQYFGENSTETAMTAYPMIVSELINGYDARDAWPIWFRSDNDSDPKSYHGSVVISQTWNGKTYKQKSQFTAADAHTYLHRLFVPDATDDTLVYNVSLEPDPGYAMTLKDYIEGHPEYTVFGWSDDDGGSGDPPDGEGWGFNLDPEVMTLKVQPSRMSSFHSEAYVSFTVLHYNVEFSRPTDAEVFVASKWVSDNKYEVDWFESQTDVTVNNIKTPILYDENGCQVYWKVKDSEAHVDTGIVGELVYMTSTETLETAINVLVPDTDESNRNCDNAETYKQTLTVEGEGTILLEQVIGDAPESPEDPAQVVLAHSFVEDEATGVLTMNVPAAYNEVGPDFLIEQTGVKFRVVAVPAENYTLDKISYETAKNGNVMTVSVEDSAEVNVMESLPWTVKFKSLAPIYVTYDLSLVYPDDSADTYLPTNAAKSESLELASNADTVSFWKPYRVSTCFKGWSTTAAANYTADDSAYTTFNAGNFTEFSTNPDNPTTLYAIWGACPETRNIWTVENGQMNATLVLYQLFGDDTLFHEVSNRRGLTLEGDAFDVYIDPVRSAPKSGYHYAADAKYELSYQYQLPVTEGSNPDIETVEVEPDAEKGGVWHLTSVGIPSTPTYTFTTDVEMMNYLIVFDVNTKNATVFYGPDWVKEKTLTLGSGDEDKAFPQDLRRTDACFEGWVIPGIEEPEIYSNFDEVVDALKDVMATVETVQNDEGESVDHTYYTLSAQWNSNCTPETFKIFSGMTEGQGTFQVSQNPDAENAVWMEVPEDGLVIPELEGLSLAVKFTGADTYETGDVITGVKADAENAEQLFEIENGESFTVAAEQPDVKLNVEANLIEMNFALDAGFDDVFYGPGFSWNWSSDGVAFGAALPTNLYRAGYKLAGWKFDNEETPMLYFGEDFAAAYSAYAESHGGDYPDTLHAVWTVSGVIPAYSLQLTEETLDQNSGVLTLSQTIGDSTIVHVFEDGMLDVPMVEDLALTVNFAIDTAHSFDGETPITLKSYFTEDTFGSYATGDELVVHTEVLGEAGTVMVNVATKVDSYEFAFDINVGEDDQVFYGKDWFASKSYDMSEEELDSRFPASAYQTQNCLGGFAFTAMEPLEDGYTITMPDVKFYTGIDSAFIADYKALEEKPTTLYAVWLKPGVHCSAITSNVMISALNTSEEGVFTLTNADMEIKLPASEESAAVQVPVADDLEFTVTFTPTSAYDFDAETGTITISLVDGYDYTLVNAKTYSFAKNATLKATPTLKAVAFDLNANAGEASVFYGKEYAKTWTSTGVAYGDELPKNIYRTDANFLGWAFTALEDNATEGFFTKFDKDFMDAYAAQETVPTTLYAVWKTDDERETYKIASASTDAGDLLVAQFVGEDSLGYAVTAAGLTVPAESDLEFKAYFTVNMEHTLASVSQPLTLMNADEEETPFGTIANGGAFTLQGNTSIVANTSDDAYEFVFDVNAGDATVFYGTNWVENLVVEMTDATASRDFPTSIYRTDKCLQGFSFDSENQETHYEGITEEFVTAFKDGGYSSPKTLYAVWGDCPDDHKNVSVTVANTAAEGWFSLGNYVGDIENEFDLDEDHESLLVPVADDLEFTVSFVSGGAYTFNGVINVLDADAETPTLVKELHSTDTYTFKQNVKLQAVTEFVKVELVFDLNVDDANVFFTSDFDGLTWNVNDYGDEFPSKIVRADKVFAGWGFTRDAAEGFTAYDNDFVIAYNEFSDSHDLTNAPVTLYALWIDAPEAIETYHISLQNSYDGKLTLSQSNAGVVTEYEVGADGIDIPVNANREFRVTFDADYAYSLAAGTPITISEISSMGNVTGETSIANGGVFEFDANSVISVEMGADKYILAFDVNAGDADVFYGTNWFASKTYDMADEDLDAKFPTSVYQNGKCLSGYTFDAAGTGDVFTEINPDFISAYKALEEAPEKLYAVWYTGDCDQASVTVASGNKDHEATFVLTNAGKDYEVSEENPVEVPVASDLEFTVAFTAGSAYSTDDKFSVVMGNSTDALVSGDTYTFTRNAELLANVNLKLVNVALKMNAGEANVFYARDYENVWDSEDVEYGTELPKNVYRADADLLGWAFEAIEDDAAEVWFTKFDNDFVEAYAAASAGQGDGPTPLYAVWKTNAERATYTITSTEETLGAGNLVVAQWAFADSVGYAIGAAGLKVPAENNLIFRAYFEPLNTHSVVGDLPVALDVDGEVTNVFVGQDFVLAGNTEITVATENDVYVLAFDANADGATLFYGDNWFSGKTYSPADAEEDLNFPTSLYRTDKCLDGFAFNADESVVYKSISDEFITEFKERELTSPVTLVAVWKNCPETYANYTVAAKDASEGVFTLTNKYGEIANKFEVGSEALVIPAAEDLTFSVTFAENVTVDYENKVSILAGNETVATVVDGATVSFSQNSELKAVASVFDLTFAFDANKAANDTVFYNSEWSATKSYDLADEEFDYHFPTAYQTSKCIAGFSFSKTATESEAFQEVGVDFVRAYKALEVKPTTLYAVWTTEDCNHGYVVLRSGNTEAEGSFTISDAINSYELPAGSLMAVPTHVVDFKVTFHEGHAYELENIDLLDDDLNSYSGFANGAEYSFDMNTVLKANVEPKSKGLVFALNAEDATVFYGTSYDPKWFENLMNGDFYNDNLPSGIYRNDAVFVGWSFTQMSGVAEGSKYFTKIDDDFYEAFKNHAETRENFDTPDTLYAVWKSAPNREIYTVTVGNKASEGKFRLTNASGGLSNEFLVDATTMLVIPAENDLVFTVSFVSASETAEYEGISVISTTGTQIAVIEMGDEYTFRKDVMLRAISYMPTMEFALDVNAGDADVFYEGDFGFKWWASSYGQYLPTGIYRTDAKLVGWSLDKNATPDKAFKEIDDAFNEAVESYMEHYGEDLIGDVSEGDFDLSKIQEMYGMDFAQMSRGPVLYAVWEKADVKTVSVKSNSLRQGTLTLQQLVDDSTFTFVVGEKGLKVPYVEGGLEFRAHFEANESHLLNSGKSLVWNAAAADTTKNDEFVLVSEATSFDALVKVVGFNLAFNAESKETLFYGDDWTSGKKVIAKGTSASQFPTMVYSASRCLVGWTLKNDVVAYTEMQDELANKLYEKYPKLTDTTKINMYALWSDSPDQCSALMTRVSVEQDKGEVMLVEKTGESNEVVHKFNEKGSMMLPSDIVSAEWTLRSAPDSSYALDSLTIVRNDKLLAVLREGGNLPGNMDNAVFKAHFSKANKTPVEIVERHFAQSGNAIQLNIKASEFEVTRGVEARVRVFDVKDDSVVLDSLLGDSVAMGFESEVVLRMKRTGDYKVVLTLEDEKESDAFEQEFGVKSSIASVGKDGWQMVSLAAVDTSAINWTSDDQVFYWWDEFGNGGDYWQYKRYNRGDSVVATRGAWYSSLDSLPLVLKRDIEDDGEDAVWKLDSIHSGWNLVANTHGWEVSLFAGHADEEKDVDEESEISFYRYNSETADYEETKYLKPYEAVWAKVGKKKNWKVSAAPVFAKATELEPQPEKPEGGRMLPKRVLAKASTKDRWVLQAVLSDKNGKQDAWNILGAGNNPFSAEEPPESMGDHVNLSIVEGKRALAKSIKSASDEMEWTVALSASNDRVGYLTLVGIDDVNAFGYRVFVTVDGNTTEMKDGVPLQVLLKSNAKTATVRVAPAAKVVAQNSLKGLRSARLGGKLKVSFEATGLAGTNARVDLLDMKGHVMSTVNAKTLEGTNALVLDAPKSGLYMLRVRAGSQQQAAKVMVK